MRAFLSVFLILFVLSGWGQEKVYLFRNLDKDQGLSNNNIKCFLKDRQGFIWAGTNEGLNRYDGYGFKVFRNVPSDPTSIKENLVSMLFEDHQGKIWVMAGDYIDIFDPVTETFNHSQSLFDGKLKIPPVSKSYPKFDARGNIWYGNSSLGLYKYVVKTNELIHFPKNEHDPHCLASDSITSLDIDSKGNVWVANIRCYLEKVNAQTGLVEEKIKLPSFTDHNYKIFIDRDDDVWLYDQNVDNGVFRYIPNTKTLENHKKGDPAINLPINNVSAITQEENGKIWIGMDHGGILIFDKNKNSSTILTSNPLNPRGLHDNSVTTLFKDLDGFIWVGTFKSGIGYFHENLFNFNLFNISINKQNDPTTNDIDNFAEDADGNLWIGTNGAGLMFFDRNKHSFKQFKHDPLDPKSLGADVVIGMLYDSRNRLWIGTFFGGLNLYRNNGFVRLKNDPDDPMSLSDDRVWDICEDKDGLIWVATLLGGVNVIDPNTLKIVRIIKGLQSDLGSNVVFDIYKDKAGNLWFATVDGVRMLNTSTNKWTRYEHKEGDDTSLSKNYVFSILEDSRGWIWVATADGLNLLDKSTGKFKRLRTADGLPSDFVLTVTEDNAGSIWISSSNGLSCITPSIDAYNKKLEFSIKNYDDLDGLQGKEFNEKSAFKTKQGELLFGGKNGFNMFDPSMVSHRNVNASTVLTDFQLFNKPISNKTTIRGKQIMSQTINFVQQIELDFNSSVFSIEFSNLNFFFPEKRLYRYKLEGFHNEWIQTDGSNRKATYTNLNPGKYTFRVASTNTDGSWTGDEAQLIIVVRPPWYYTWWFKLFLTTAILLSVLAVYFYRIKRFKRNQTMLVNMVEERTAELQNLNAILEERQEEISLQNEELAMHRNQLEDLVDQRTYELEEAKKKAEESDHLKSAFLANMSHEIRTPMNAIIGFSTLLKDDSLTNDERNEYTDIIQNNCESLLVLINDVLDISKIEANQIDISNTNFDVTQMMTELEHFYKLQETPDVMLGLRIDDKYAPFYIYSDPFRLKQILQNLINNALKFTLRGQVLFGYIKDDDAVRFFVSDTGIGIDSNDFKRIFEQFNKLDTSNVRHFKGTGLGLAISKKLTELLNGKIWVESQKGLGATFYVSIPIR